MIKNIYNLLKIDDFAGISENIDIAKGKNELTINVKKMHKQIKRLWQSKK